MVCSSLGVFRQSAEGFRRRLRRLSSPSSDDDDGRRRRRDRDTGIPTDHGVVTLEGGGGGGVLFRDTGYAGWEVRCVELGIGRVLGVDATPLVPGVVARRNEDDDDGEGSGGGGGTHRSTFLPSGTSSTSLLHNLTPVTVDHIYHRVWTSLHRVILTGVRGDVWAFGEGLFGGGRWAAVGGGGRGRRRRRRRTRRSARGGGSSHGRSWRASPRRASAVRAYARTTAFAATDDDVVPLYA